MATTRLLRREEVLDRLGIRRTKLAEMVRTGELPGPVIVSGTVRAWPEDEILEFINRRISTSRGAHTPGELV